MKRKTVFLFNTHLDNIMNKPDELMNRLNNIYKLFNKRDDVILLWRPHPLSIPTIQSMQTELYETYCGFVEKIKKDSSVIYDESADLHRAIAVSDAYLGDFSSLVPIYGMSGKPMMILGPLRQDYLKKKSLFFMAGAQYKGSLYFSVFYFNGLFKMDLSSGKIAFLGRFSTEALYSAGLHQCAVIIGDNCWFIPRCGTCITIVNLKTIEMRSLSLPEDCRGISGAPKFNTIWKDGEQIWLLAAACASVIKIDLKTEKMVLYAIKHEGENTVLDNGVRINNDTVCFFSANQSEIIKLHTDTGNISNIKLPYPKASFRNMVYDGTYIWFPPQTYDAVVKWNPADDSYTELRNFPRDFRADGKKFYISCLKKGNLWMFPDTANMIVCLNPVTGEMEGIHDYPSELKAMRNIGQGEEFSFCYAINDTDSEDELLVNLREYNMFFSIEPVAKRIKGYGLTVSEEDYRKYCEGIIANGYALNSDINLKYIADNYCEDIDQFIDFVCRHQDCDEFQEARRKEISRFSGIQTVRCGNEVWNVVKQNIQ